MSRGPQRRCIVKGCGQKTNVYALPNLEQIRLIWLTRIGYEDKKRNLDNAKVCPRHFAPSCFRKIGKNGLQKFSLPTLFLPEYVPTGEMRDNFCFPPPDPKESSTEITPLIIKEAFQRFDSSNSLSLTPDPVTTTTVKHPVVLTSVQEIAVNKPIRVYTGRKPSLNQTNASDSIYNQNQPSQPYPESIRQTVTSTSSYTVGEEKKEKPPDTCLLCNKGKDLLTNMEIAVLGPRTFHSFPVKPALRETWFDFCGTFKEFFKPESKLCSLHFNESDFECRTNRMVLKQDAIPTISMSQLKEYAKMHDLYKRFDKICRICASSSNLVEVDDFYKRLSNLTKTSVYEEKLPRQICVQCQEQVRSFNLFIEKIDKQTNYFDEILERFEKDKKPRDRDQYANYEDSESESEVIEIKEEDIDMEFNEFKEEASNEAQNAGDQPRKKAEQILPEKRELHYSCRKCGEIFDDQESAYRDHQCSRQLCYICGVTVNHLRHHLDVHSTEEKYFCKDCDFKTVTSKRLWRHIKMKHSDPKYLCEYCSKPFYTTCTYNRHLETHLGLKYICSICNKEYSSRRGLKDHLNIHTGEKPYRCKVCGQGFEFGSTYSSHNAWHKRGGIGSPYQNCKKKKRTIPKTSRLEETSVFNKDIN